MFKIVRQADDDDDDDEASTHDFLHMYITSLIMPSPEIQHFI
jgi:hypothetical protein